MVPEERESSARVSTGRPTSEGGLEDGLCSSFPSPAPSLLIEKAADGSPEYRPQVTSGRKVNERRTRTRHFSV